MRQRKTFILKSSVNKRQKNSKFIDRLHFWLNVKCMLDNTKKKYFPYCHKERTYISICDAPDNKLGIVMGRFPFHLISILLFILCKFDILKCILH